MTITTREILRATDVSKRLVAAGSALTVTLDDHEGRIVALDTAAGSAVTLPAAVGSGAVYKFIVSVTPTSNAHTISCVGSDEFAGAIYAIDIDADTGLFYPALAADNFDTITMNSGSQGGEVGDWVEVTDIAAGVYAVKGCVNQGGGSEATPFSAS